MFLAVIFFQILVIKALDPDPDPYWSPASNAGSGSRKNEYKSETLVCTLYLIFRRSVFVFFRQSVADDIHSCCVRQERRFRASPENRGEERGLGHP